MNKSRIAIYLPHYGENSLQKKGFFSKQEVELIEDELKNDKNIEYLGNVNFNNIQIINDEIVCDKINLSKIDLFFWHSPGMLKNMRYLQILAEHTKVIKHPSSFEIVSDKFYAHSLLRKHGIPVADFALIKYNDIETMKQIMKDWGTILIKPRLGSYGRGVTKINDVETLRDIAGILKFESSNNYIFVERYYENDPDEWMSTTLINNKTIYGYRKNEDRFDDWKVYDINKEGGSVKYVDPSPVKKYAEKASQILNDKSIVGFDFIKTKKGYKIIDENNFPGLYPHCFEEGGENLAKLILNTIKKSL